MKTQQETNILPFDCPFWKKETLIIITQTEDPEERSRFFSHCAKCNICKRKALEILGNDSSIKPNKTKRFYITVLIAAMLLVFFGVVYKNREALKYPDLQRSTSIVLTNSNLYDQLDSSINKYLDSGNKTELIKAKAISEEILLNYKDNWGKDLIGYYSNLPNNKRKELLLNRQELHLLITGVISDNYSLMLQKAENLEQAFIDNNDILEAYETKTLKEKLYMFQCNAAYLPIYKETLKYAESNNYTYLELQAKVWDLKFRSNNSSSGIEEEFNALIKTSHKLKMDNYYSSLGMSLAGVYELTDRPEKALALVEEILTVSQPNYSQTVSMLHIGGLAAFRLGRNKEANNYLEQALKISKEHHNTQLTVLTYSFMGTLKTDQGDFVSAEDYFTQAETLTMFMRDVTARTELEASLIGYKAKNELSKGNYLEASNTYKEALNKFMDIGRESDLQISQLNEGVAIALEKLGNKKEALNYRLIATNQSKRAEKDNVRLSCLLSFLPASCG